MKSFECPNCGAKVDFQSAASVFTVCAYCHSTLLRNDVTLENLGTMAVLQNDASPLQIGTGGKCEGRAFTLIGRTQLSWEDGTWNEWYMYLDGDKPGWLAEAQGFYMVSFEAPYSKDAPPREAIALGLPTIIGGKSYTVKDIKICSVTYSEGELPFKAQAGRESMSVDLTGDNDAFCCLDYSEDGVKVFTGKYYNFSELHFSNLREFDGW